MFAGESGARTRAALLGVGVLHRSYGRFMQTDPLGYGDGLNWYNYAGSDPVNGADPSGMAGETVQKPHIYCTDDCTGSRIPGNVSPSNFGFTGSTRGGTAYYGGGGGTQAGGGVTSTGNCSSNCPGAPGAWQRTMTNGEWGAWHLVGGGYSSALLGAGAQSSVPEEPGDVTVNGRRWRDHQSSAPALSPGDAMGGPYNPKVHYCGSAGHPVFEGNWGEACYRHDRCYSTLGNSKLGCDVRIARDIAVICTIKSKDVIACATIGFLYGYGLQFFGQTPFYHPARDAYEAAQRR